MKVTPWNGGAQTYGIRVGIANRDRYFKRHWKIIQVEMDGQFSEFQLTSGFWHKCPEFRDRGTPVIREWLESRDALDWPNGKPPRFQLIEIGDARFRLIDESTS
jgi:hypothetical protein